MARTKAVCQGCGVIEDVHMMVKSECANRGAGKYAYLCNECATKNLRYTSGREMAEVGKVFDGFRFGIEFETTGSTLYFRNMMLRYDFIPTHDGSLHDDDRGADYIAYGMTENSCEYVSSTNMGMKRFSKQFVEFERCLNDGEVFMDSSCGTHCHISYHNMQNNEMAMIRDYFEALFKPMEDVMYANRYYTEQFFGRFFDDNGNRYAPRIDYRNVAQADHDDRYCWVNATNDSNIEFRINRFLNAKQMRECIMFEKWIVKCIINNFTSKFNTTNNRHALAVKTGRKMANKLKKVYETM